MDDIIDTDSVPVKSSSKPLPQDEDVGAKNINIPNGCLNHLEDNGLVKLSKGKSVTSDSDCVSESLATAADCDDDLTKSDTPAQKDSQSSNNCCTDSHEQGESTAHDCVAQSLEQLDLSESTSPIEYVVYESEQQMPDIMRLITKDLSEPYSIYTYRYFIHNWPRLCFLAMSGSRCVGAIVCKLDMHKKMVRRGYIAMLAIDENFRRRGIDNKLTGFQFDLNDPMFKRNLVNLGMKGLSHPVISGSHLVMKAIRAMVADDCDEVVLETEITNKAALRLYENLGFVRDKRLFRYYLNGVDALRLKLWLR